MNSLNKLNLCPLPTLRWCTIDQWEMEKCQKMANAFGAKGIQPDLKCIQSQSTTDCMRLIHSGYVDMVSVDAGDLYTAGKFYDLVPIVAETYGIGPFYYAVAIAKKADPRILISNWKFARTCHSGVGKATGWIIPLNVILDTVQVRVLGGHLIHSFSKSFAQVIATHFVSCLWKFSLKSN
ncbi:unnamed protein product [Protopolystoma xenopodis]|uniref:Transferrin-like domain-containing protein n=1 Tax=Protopolystoma xenopodis TaxID=117903 RepID=A0A3S5BRU8_9PLAT|nr:unnamed protein product [Protopolystoma xenopodis]